MIALTEAELQAACELQSMVHGDLDEAPIDGVAPAVAAFFVALAKARPVCRLMLSDLASEAGGPDIGPRFVMRLHAVAHPAIAAATAVDAGNLGWRIVRGEGTGDLPVRLARALATEWRGTPAAIETQIRAALRRGPRSEALNQCVDL